MGDCYDVFLFLVSYSSNLGFGDTGFLIYNSSLYSYDGVELSRESSRDHFNWDVNGL